MLLEIGYGLVLTCAVSLIHVKCGDDQRSHWYSRYGPVDYGRDVSLGTFQGSLSRLGCSRLCSDTDSCQSFQHFSESGKPICYTYTSYTHSRLMVPPTNANYMYYEKRSCMNLLQPTAAVIFYDIQELFVMSYSTLRRMRYTIDGNQYHFQISWTGSLSTVFPGFLTNVDAATECRGNYTVLFSGSSASCFSRNGSVFTAEVCPPDLFTDYFNQSGYSDLSAITPTDENFDNMYIFKNNVAYSMQYDVIEDRYLFNGSMAITDAESPWSEAPDGIAGVCYLGNDAYFIYETHKWYFYFTKPTRRIAWILYLCK